MGEKKRGKEIKANTRIMMKTRFMERKKPAALVMQFTLISPCSDLTWELL